MNLNPLYARAIAQFNTSNFPSRQPWLAGFLPILYFGDVAAYAKSARKIITVGLNPSDSEFSTPRFQLSGAGLTSHNLERCLSDYFQVNPYRKWFDPSFETLLQPLGATYYRRTDSNIDPPWWKPQDNIALHTDICTPLATTPTWSKLPAGITAHLRHKGTPLWFDLVDQLDPHLILISVAKHYLSLFGNVGWRQIHPFPGAQSRHTLHIAKYKNALIVWGQPQVRPFLHFSSQQRIPVAIAIKKILAWP